MPSFATTPPRFATLVLLSGLSVLSLNMFLPSLANIASDFGSDYATVSLSIAGYAAMTAVLQLIVGPLSDRFGRRPVLLAAVAIFLLASIGCALSTSIWAFLAFRMMQAAIISGYTVSMAVIRDCAPAREAASRIGYIAAAWAVAPLIGPTAGGVLDALFGWRASFWVFSGLGLAVFVLCWLDLGETNTAPSSSMAAQFRSYPALLGSPLFWAYSLCMAFSIGTLYAFLAGVPLVADVVFGLSPLAIGLCMAVTTSGFIAGSFLSGRLSGRWPLPAMVLGGRVVACLGLAGGIALVLAGILHPVSFFAPAVFVGIGNGLSMPGSSAGAMSVDPRLVGSASGVSGALAVAGGAVMSMTAGILLADASAHGSGLPLTMLGVMFLSAVLSLLAAVAAGWLSRAEKTAPEPLHTKFSDMS